MTTPNARATLAAALWDATEPPQLISHRENAVYAVQIGARKAALRLHRQGYRTDPQILSELAWSNALVDAGLAVPHALASNTGALLRHLPDGTTVTATSWIDGTPIGDSATRLGDDALPQHRELGGVLARLHQISDAWQAPCDFTRPAWNREALTGPDPAWGRFWTHPGLTHTQSETLCQARDKANQILRTTTLDQGLIHADAMRENVFTTPTGLTLIDFDDSGIGYRHYDLACALIQSFDDPRLPAFAQNLITGYTQHRPLTRPDLIPMFVMLRAFSSLGWVIARYPASDPKHHSYKTRALSAATAFIAGAPLFQMV